MPEDFDPFPNISPEQARAIFAQMVTTGAMDDVDTMPEIKVDDDGGDKCCAEAKSKWITYLTEEFAKERGMIEYEDEFNTRMQRDETKEYHDSIIEGYEAMDCDEFKQFLGNIAGVMNDHPVYRSHNDRGRGLPRTSESYEAARIMESWNACEFGAGEGAEDMGFYASADPFEYSWNMIIKGLGGFER